MQYLSSIVTIKLLTISIHYLLKNDYFIYKIYNNNYLLYKLINILFYIYNL
jgi:hypothetical protein